MAHSEVSVDYTAGQVTVRQDADDDTSLRVEFVDDAGDPWALAGTYVDTEGTFTVDDTDAATGVLLLTADGLDVGTYQFRLRDTDDEITWLTGYLIVGPLGSHRRSRSIGDGVQVVVSDGAVQVQVAALVPMGTYATSDEVDALALGGTYEGAWDDGTAYDGGAIVEHEGSTYAAGESTSAGDEPGDSSKWQVVIDGSAYLTEADAVDTYAHVFSADAATYGDGVTDAAAHLQARNDAAETAGGVLYVPEGDFLVSEQVSITVPMLCASRNGVTFTASASMDSVFEFLHNHGSWKNFTVDANSLATHGIIYRQARRSIVESVKCVNAVEDGHHLDAAGGSDNCNLLLFLRCEGRENGQDGFGSTRQSNHNGVEYISCEGNSNGRYGLLIRQNNQKVWGGIYVSNDEYGIQVGVDGESTLGALVVRPWLEDNTSGGVRLGSVAKSADVDVYGQTQGVVAETHGNLVSETESDFGGSRHWTEPESLRRFGFRVARSSDDAKVTLFARSTDSPEEDVAFEVEAAGMAVDGPLSGSRAPVRAADMEDVKGSPSKGAVGSVHPAWVLHKATGDSVSFTVDRGRFYGWGTCDLVVIWASDGSASGDARIEGRRQFWSAGDTLGSGSASTVDDAADGTNVPVETTIWSGVAVTADKDLTVRLTRVHDHANDTLTDDIQVLGAVLIRAS